MEESLSDVMAILKLYELRREQKMRDARRWYFSEFEPQSAMEIVALYKEGESASAKFRMVVSYWDMAASFVINGRIDEKTFLDSNTEHIFVFAKVEPYLTEIREIFGESDYLLNLETLCKNMPDYNEKLASRQKLAVMWASG